MLNSGDIGFMIIAATYVFLMTPGLAFFYGGLAQRKNVLNTMMTNKRNYFQQMKKIALD